MLLHLLLTLGTVAALQPPAGWTALAPDRAVLDPKDPKAGELREITVPGGTGAASEVQSALQASGIQATVVSQTPMGRVTLQTTDDRLVQAQASVKPSQTDWYVVMASRTAASQLDVNALMTAMQSAIPLQLTWGQEIEVLPAGADGSLWGVGAEEPPASPWGAETESWVLDPSLYGLWAGNLETRGPPTEVKVRLETSGRVRVERVTEGRMNVTEGTWGVRGGQIRFAWYTSEPATSPYQVDSKSLSFTLDQHALTLRKVK